MVVGMAGKINGDEEMVASDSVYDVIANEERRNNLLQKISSTSAFFKSQQRGEPDLTYAEKYNIGSNLLDESPHLFLARFSKYLDSNDVAYFDKYRGNYEVDFYVKEILNVTSKSEKIRIKNRRYEAMKTLINEGQYFSNSEMKKRNPLLFEQLVGQYMDEEEREQLEAYDKTDLRFTSILMEHIDMDYQERLRRTQEVEEFDDDDSDENVTTIQSTSREHGTNTSISEEEKRMFKEEFLSHMYQSFLDGHDDEFNYSSVDSNTDYDAIYVKQQDAEDNYFDAEEPDSDNSPDLSGDMIDDIDDEEVEENEMVL